MRILIVCNIPPWAKGGAETQAMKLGFKWREFGHDVVIAGQLIPTTTMERDGVNVQLRHIPFISWSRSLRGVSYFLGLAWFIMRHYQKFDIVYCRFVRESAVVLSLVKRLFKLDFALIPCSACTFEVGCAEFLKGLPLSKAIIASVDASANAINNISEKTGEELEKIGLNGNKFTYIGNGTAVPKLIHQFVAGRERRLVCLTRLAAYKGHTYLIDALAALKEKGKYIDMTFIGDGTEREKLEFLVQEKGLADNIRFLGHIENDQIFEQLMQYDIFILPSDSEGFATVVIEAMAVGLPAIVTRSGGPEYFIDDSVGRTCATKSARALMGPIEELLGMATEELAAMGIRGRERVKEQYEMTSVARQYEALFNQQF